MDTAASFASSPPPSQPDQVGIFAPMLQFWVGSATTALGMVGAVVGMGLHPAAYRAYTTVESKPTDKVAAFTGATTRVGWAIALKLAGACLSLVGRAISG